jgi:uncharacterized membrane protein
MTAVPAIIEEVQPWLPFAAAMVAFLATHAVPARPAAREILVGRMGRRTYLLLYSAVSLMSFGWLVCAAGQAPYVELWPSAEWQYWIPRIVVPFAFAVAAVGLAAANPLSLSVGSRRAGRERPAILGFTRHPVPWALSLWAAAHLVPNGDLAHVILFGCLLALALGGMAMLDRRARRRLGPTTWKALAALSPLVPFSGPAAFGVLPAATYSFRLPALCSRSRWRRCMAHWSVFRPYRAGATSLRQRKDRPVCPA